MGGDCARLALGRGGDGSARLATVEWATAGDASDDGGRCKRWWEDSERVGEIVKEGERGSEKALAGF